MPAGALNRSTITALRSTARRLIESVPRADLDIVGDLDGPLGIQVSGSSVRAAVYERRSLGVVAHPSRTTAPSASVSPSPDGVTSVTSPA